MEFVNYNAYSFVDYITCFALFLDACDSLELGKSYD